MKSREELVIINIIKNFPFAKEIEYKKKKYVSVFKFGSRARYVVDPSNQGYEPPYDILLIPHDPKRKI